MTRAKHRAGIPVSNENTTKSLKKKPTKTPFIATPSSIQRHTNVDSRIEKIGSVRKPAGIMERMIKVSNTKVVQPEDPRLLKVAVIGAANAGKSTLVNKIVGEEVCTTNHSNVREYLNCAI